MVLIAVGLVLGPVTGNMKLIELESLQRFKEHLTIVLLSVLFIVIPSQLQASALELLGWIAPRGIVAAATAGIFGPALVAAGFPDAALLLPITFAVIIATVLAHGLSIGHVARRLGLAAARDNGLLIVGANPWSNALASALHRMGIDVLMVDGRWCLRAAQASPHGWNAGVLR